MSPVKTAVVGLGYWGPNLVRNLNEIDTADLVAVCDQRPDRLELIERRYPGVRGYSSLDDLLADETLEAVAIATPVTSHHPIALACLAAGKHVFIEKPLAASTAESLDLIRDASQRDLVLMPGHTFVYSPPVVAIHDMIVAGDLGDLYFISTSRVNLGLHQADVSVAWDLGPHDFSILRYWLGETPEFVSALSRCCVIPSVPDVAFIDLEFRTGAIAHVELSWLAPSKLRRTTIVGSKRMVVYDDTSTEPVRVFDSGVELKEPETFGEYRLTYRTGDIVSPRIDATEPLAVELKDFCAAIREGSTPRSSALLGLEVVRMIEAVDRSLENGGGRVELVELDMLAAAADA
ncbi:MAG: Gfo/Idh/MocA family protein [Gaiella sp.]